MSAAGPVSLDVDVTKQSLDLLDRDGRVLGTYPASTAANGTGQQMDSECTPLGRHVIRAKIGAGEPVNTVFRGRRPSGEVYAPGMRESQPGRDWILTRILWLSGSEPGYNRLGRVDSMRRYIYIHGTPDDVDMSVPGSRGCIRVRNDDLLALFDRVDVGTPVYIHE